MARRTSQQSVSLFPFLAVLVCTMGALILLLLVTTRRIRQEQARYTNAVETLNDLDQGRAVADDVPTVQDFIVEKPAADSLSEDAESVDIQVSDQLLPPQDDSIERFEQLTASIKEANAARQALEQRRTELEESILQQGEELQTVQQKIQATEVELLTTGKATRQLAEAESELERLKSEEADLQLELQQNEQRLAAVQAELEEKSAFTEEAEQVLTRRESALISLRRIVAESSQKAATDSASTKLEFTNTDGTARIPIVVNIDDKGFTLEPAGIQLTLNDLKGFPANDNPLLAGIQAIAEHRSDGLLAKDPYVLLLVRPSGSLGFYQAQQVMTNANIHFGYELLPANKDLDLGSPDENEVKVVRQSVLEAMNRRTHLYGSGFAAGRGRSTSESNQRWSAGSSDGRPLPPDSVDSGPAGRDGQTLQEIMGLSRVYAGGEAKPQPTVPRLAGADARRWTDETPPEIAPRQSQVPTIVTREGDQKATSSGHPVDDHGPGDIAGNLSPKNATKSVPDSLWANGEYQESVATEAHVQNNASEQTNSEAFNGGQAQEDYFRSLSENLGVKGQHSDHQMPNESSTDATVENSIVENREIIISPDVDWPSTEAAPQSEGTRPVDPALMSRQSVASPSDAQSDFPATWTPQQSESSEAMAQTNQAPSSQGQAQPPQQASAFLSSPPPNSSGQSFAQSQPGSSSNGGGPGVADQKLSHLQRFLDEVERQKAEQQPETAPRPNPVLLRLLRRAQGDSTDQLSGNLTSNRSVRNGEATNTPPNQQQVAPATKPEPAQAEPPPAEPPPAEPPPAKPAPAKPTATDSEESKPNPVFYVVRVYVSESQLIVGPFEAIDIQGWPDEHVAEAAMMGVSETMQSVWEHERKDALPSVRFLVAPGSESRFRKASSYLDSNNIPTRAIETEGKEYSLKQFFSDNLPPTTQRSGASQKPTDSERRRSI